MLRPELIFESLTQLDRPPALYSKAGENPRREACIIQARPETIQGREAGAQTTSQEMQWTSQLWQESKSVLMFSF